MNERLQVLLVYHAAKNEYTITDHNLSPEKAAQFVEESTVHLREGCRFIALDQVRHHDTSDPQDCRACRDRVRHSSGLQPPPKFKRRKE